MTTTSEKRAAFRKMHESGFFIIPNAWDAGSAARLAGMGFRAIASTSSGAAWAAGKDDGDLGLDATLDHLRMLVAATPLPVNADFENGYANDPEGVAANVSRALETGIAGLSIEDWSGRFMYEQDLAVERIAAARAAIDAVDPSVMLIGRNENFRVPGMPARDSIARAVAYAQAGADCLFVPFILDPGAVTELVAAVAPKPVNVVVHDYDDGIGRLAALGVRRCSVGGSLAKRVWTAFDAAAETLKACEPRERLDGTGNASVSRHPSFDPQPTLVGGGLALRPLVPGDLDGLYEAARDPETWAGHPATDRFEREVFEPYFRFLVESGTTLAVLDAETGRIIGCSRYYVPPDHPDGMAIGFTFLDKAYWGGTVNRELKRLMLGHAFATFETVWFHIGPTNIRSQKATAKLGARHAYDAELDLSGKPARWMCFRLDRREWDPSRMP